MKNLWRLLLLIPLTFIAIACDDEMDDDEMEPLPTLVEAAEEAGLTTLLDAVGAVDGLDQTLLGANEITVFAPTNAAFSDALAAFNAADLNELVEALGGVENLETVLGYHVVPAIAFSDDLADGAQTFNTLGGQSLTVTLSDGNVTVTDATDNTVNVVTADVAIENGVVHVIDGVLLLELEDDEDEEEEEEEELPNLVDAATEAGLTTILDAVGAVDGLADNLLAAEAITVFAPTNDAFGAALEAYNAADLNELVEALGGVENLETVLGFHVVPAVAFAGDLAEGEQTFTTLAEQDLTVTSSSEGVTVTDAAGNTFNVVTADVAIENGVVHVIDGVLLPELPLPNLVDAATDAGLTTLLDAVGAVDGLADQLLAAEAITVFAPSNDAFADALEAYGVSTLGQLVTELGGVENLETVLGFHVVPAVAFAEDLAEGDQTFTTLAEQDLTVNRTGADVTVTDAAGTTYNVVTADVAIENGVVHVIDGVLLPEITLPTVVEAATDAGLTTLIDALVAAELDDDVANAEAVTVFAPTNDAFADLLAAQEVTDLDGLIAKLGAEAVADVLTFHVVPAVAFSHDLEDGDTFTTLQGEDLTVNITEAGGVTVTDVNDNTFNVTTADVAIANGVVHVIEGVLLPTL
ncbi:Uncaracterized surface protein containing fasciclin (FAS1) repeats [Marivirga sericea]|uniref:Uncaracterized surface protein containing fasciclin (FAS1) repeats n=1 Tax=Marivirga sericea TaxID=1028 RepID=A0A1X7KBG2_9BACT|nr:fasciclin domain-containing protein [Marivirga sericea]SMG38127.1 Uncaracterized surface protein containing fasciclin (FAS1) repeats [Marivirga sericea]